MDNDSQGSYSDQGGLMAKEVILRKEVLNLVHGQEFESWNEPVQWLKYRYPADSIVGSVDGFNCTAFRWCEFDSRRPTAVWYTLYQGVFALATFPEKLSAYIMD